MKTKKYLLLCFIICTATFYIKAHSQNDSLNYYKSKIDQQVSTIELAKAYIFFDKYKEKNLEINHKAGAAYGLDYMSLIEYNLGLMYKSESSGVEALKLLDELGQSEYNNNLRHRVVNRIGNIKVERQEYRESLDDYYKLLNVVSTESNTATLYNNIGVAYKYLQEYDSAQFYFVNALEIERVIDASQLKLAKALDNLGFVQGMQDEKEGLDNMMKALSIRRTKNTGLFTSYKHLTEFYMLKGNKSKALSYAQDSYEASTKNELERLEALSFLLELDQYQYTSEFLKLNDKVSTEKQLNENKFAKAKYDFNKAELRAAQEKSKRITYQSSGIVISLILILIIIVLRIRHRKKLLIKQFETEQHISKKLHDEVANDVFHTITKVRGNKTNQLELLDALDDIYHKVRDISKSNSDLDVTKDYGRLLNDLINSYKTEHVNILTINTSKIVWTEISEIKRKMLYRVLQELMVNMKKHSQATLVTLNFEKVKGKLHIRYIDNGVGCSLEKGSGLTNTESRMEMVGGQITFESEIDKGFRANLIL